MNKLLQFKRKNGFLMKFSFVMLFLILISGQISAASLLQKNVTIKLQNATIITILEEIQKQTGLSFIYNNEELNNLPRQNIYISNESVETILSEIFKDKGFNYKIIDNNISITKSPLKQKNPEKITIKGKVIDSDSKKAIVGATIIIVSDNSGAITDNKGEFSLVTELGKKIEVSFMGMKTQIITITNSNLTIYLEKDAIVVDDIIVTGIANINKESFTGNATVVTKEQLLRVSSTNVIRALEAYDPSFRIKENNQWGSDPNAVPEVYIRGESGIGVKGLDRDAFSKSQYQDNPNLPAFFMDGFQIDVQQLYDFDPNRIKTVTILKDAAATALYGSRAANGVIIITTVAPEDGELNVSYSFTGSVKTPDLSTYNLANASEKLEIERLAGAYDKDFPGNETYYRNVLEKEYNDKRSEIIRGVDTYWLSLPLKTSFNHQHTLNVDGGADALRYGINMSYRDENGVMKGSGRDVVDIALTLSYISDKLQIRNKARYVNTRSKDTPYGNFSTYANALPYNTYENPDGSYPKKLETWGSSSGVLNPMYLSTLNNYDNQLDNLFVNQLSLNWDITNDLGFEATFEAEMDIDNREKFVDPLSDLDQYTLDSNPDPGSLRVHNNRAIGYSVQAKLRYNKEIKEHRINFTAALDLIDNKNESSLEIYNGFPSGALNSPNYAMQMYNKPNYNDGIYRSFGAIGFLNYSFKNIYLLDASARIDGNSTFGENQRYAPFWATGVGLNIHNYGFLSNNNNINLLKIRATYGETGKAGFSAWQSRSTYKTLSDEWYKTGYGAILHSFGNTNLTWETTTEFDIGGELGLFQNMVYLKASYYHKLTKDLVSDATLPSSTGFISYKDNVGEILNEGFELELRVVPIRTRDYQLSINANWARNTNTILKISESLKAYNERVIALFSGNTNNDYDAYGSPELNMPFLQYVENGSMTSLFGVMSNGVNPATGEEVYIRPDGTLDDEWNASYQVAMGNTAPKGSGFFSFISRYKMFDLNIFFNYSYGGDIFNETLLNKVENVNVYTHNVDKRVLTERWQKPGDISQFTSLQTGRSGNIMQTRSTSRFLQVENYLNLSRISLTYNMPNELVKKLGLGNASFEVGADNLFEISSIKREEGTYYPFARTFNFSIRVSL